MTKWGWRVCAFLVATGVAGASAETTAGFGLSKRDANAPIEVSADRFDADFNSKQGTYSGNVLVKQGDFHMRADNRKQWRRRSRSHRDLLLRRHARLFLRGLR